MKNIFRYTIIIFLLIAKYSFPQINDSEWNWARQLNGPSNEEEIDAITSDSQGNVYISGKFEDTLYIQGLSDTLISAGEPDIMFCKYDPNGNLMWTKHYGSSGNDNIFDAACDSDDNIIVSGYFEGSVTFDTITLTADGEVDMMVLKFAPNGDIIWGKKFGGSDEDGGNEVAIGPNNRILVAGQSKGTFNADSFSFNNTGLQDSYLLSLTTDGTVEWVRSVEGAGLVRGKSVGVDLAGNTYFGGDYAGANGIQAPSGLYPFTYVGLRDAFVSCWSPSGELKWYKNWGGNGNEFCRGIAVNEDYQVYMMGPFTQSVTIEGENLVSSGDEDMFILQTDTSGVMQWIRQISSPNTVTGSEVEISPNGGIMSGLSIIEEADFETNGTTIHVTAPGSVKHPVFMLYDKNGDFNHVKLPDAADDGRLEEISRSGNTVYLDYVFNGYANFNGSIVETNNINNQDAAIVSLELISVNTINENQETILEIYPNPTSKFITISSNQTSMNQITISDLSGKTVWEASNISNQVSVDCSSFSKGLYIITLRSDYHVASKKFFKQ